MKTKKIVLSMFLPVLAVAFSGKIIDQYKGFVSGADIAVYTTESNEFLGVVQTDSSGSFVIPDSLSAIRTSQLMLPYPNPSFGDVIIPFYCADPGRVEIDIFDLSGRKVRSFMLNCPAEGISQLKWKGLDESGKQAPAGLYLVQMTTENKVTTAKFSRLGKTGPAVYPADLNSIAGDHLSVGKINLDVSAGGESLVRIDSVNMFSDDTLSIYLTRKVDMPFKAEGEFIKICRNGEYEPVFLKGVNLGVAVPGTQPGQMAATREQYASWIRDMAQNGLNYVRTYTLHYPRFYEELRDYNLEHPQSPLFLLQGVWLDEEYEGDLFSQTEKMNLDIEEVIDCLHGNRSISHRYGRAYGEFTVDVSPWIAGYIIGREIHPSEVGLVEINHPDYTSYSGDFFSIYNALPLDVWMTEHLDYLVFYEDSAYGMKYPVSVSSWPTLDPLRHPTEDTTQTDEDVETLDMANIMVARRSAGFFISYHAYPYYPDFISEDPGYQTYSDEIGPNSYLGYLHDLNDHYENIPLLIAEFGIPSSWGNAHFAHNGLHHGGFSEKEQGEGNVRLLKNIHESGAAGGLMFAWIDEWFKNAWITEPIASGASRRFIWQNVTNPEQNYGLHGFSKGDPDYDLWPRESGSGSIVSLAADMDNAYFFADIELDAPLPSDDTLWIAFDTYDAQLGESILPNGSSVGSRSEFVLAVNRSVMSPMYVTQAYDLFGIWHNASEPEQLYRSIVSNGSPWNPIRWKNNRYEYSYQEIGQLRTALDGAEHSSLDGVRFDVEHIHIRIPWTLLQITDPSSIEVMHDDRSTPERETRLTDGIVLTVIHGNDRHVSSRFLWETWEAVDVLDTPEYIKNSYLPFINGIKKIPAVPAEDL